MKQLTRLLVIAMVLALSTANAFALPIVYEVNNLAGDRWEYRYDVTNDPANTFAIEEFTVYFDLGLYDTLQVGNTPTGWDALVVQPDSGFPPGPGLGDGFYDALAVAVPGIAPGDSVGGFSVQFTYLGTGTPGAQFYEIVDPETFEPLQSGATTTAVPEPGSLLLLVAGLLILIGTRSRVAWRRELCADTR